MKSTVILILKKWWFKTLTFCLILSAVSILASGQRDSQTKNSIVKMNEKFMEEFKSADAQRLAEFYAADAQLLPSGAPSIIGKEHILGYWQMGMKAGIKDCVLQTVEAEEYGDKIIEQGTYAIYAGEDFIVDKGKYIVIWKKEAGKLKISRDIFNSDNPPPPPAPRAIEKDTMLIIYNYIKPEMIEEYTNFNTKILDPVVNIDNDTPQGSVRTLQGLKKNEDGTYTCIYLVDPSSSNANYGMLNALVNYYGDEKGNQYYEIFNSCLAGYSSSRYLVTAVW